MPKFNLNPVTVEAIRVSDVLKAAVDLWKGVPRWLKGYFESGDLFVSVKGIEIKTSQGRLKAEGKDWIVRGLSGELSVLDNDTFKKTYTRVPKEDDPEAPENEPDA